MLDTRAINTIVIDFTIAKKFSEHIENTDISYITIAKGIKKDRCYLYKALSGKVNLSESLRQKLNTFLGTNF